MTEAGNQNARMPFGLKWIALLSIVRWYNILLTIFAQYLSAFVLMRDEPQTLHDLLSDFKLHGIVLASIFSIAGGFIINNFYDFEKDLINRPRQVLFNRMLSKRRQLNLYFTFNLAALLVAFLSSFKIGIFFLIFTAALWLYSHKLQKMAFIKELAASTLSVACFFAVLLHFSRYYPFIFVYGAFYMSLVYSREVVKQFINYNGDLATDRHSIPVSLGLEKARAFLGFVQVLSFSGGLGILLIDGWSQRNYFIALSLLLIVVSGFLAHRNQYQLVNTFYKIILVLGILNILLM
ncbi:MAG: geranylgeranylglycerol-phosphate geranylgeranyltransferase [Bacteroidia bacterium]|nr:geranylgeranylglycerol-phosphate geranylgeranyltransferase [Bacteroidia bacterium]